MGLEQTPTEGDEVLSGTGGPTTGEREGSTPLVEPRDEQGEEHPTLVPTLIQWSANPHCRSQGSHKAAMGEGRQVVATVEVSLSERQQRSWEVGDGQQQQEDTPE